MDSDEIVDFEKEEENPVQQTSSSSTNDDDDRDYNHSDRHNKVRIKGRGHSNIDNQGRYDDRGASFESIDHESDRGPIKCEKISICVFKYCYLLT
jgi:hypothetical protein